jgi:hypothetical protein
MTVQIPPGVCDRGNSRYGHRSHPRTLLDQAGKCSRARPGNVAASWPPGGSPVLDHRQGVALHRFHDRVDLDRLREVISEEHQQAQAGEQQDDGAADGEPGNPAGRWADGDVLQIGAIAAGGLVVAAPWTPTRGSGSGGGPTALSCTHIAAMPNETAFPLRLPSLPRRVRRWAFLGARCARAGRCSGPDHPL